MKMDALRRRRIFREPVLCILYSDLSVEKDRHQTSLILLVEVINENRLEMDRKTNIESWQTLAILEVR